MTFQANLQTNDNSANLSDETTAQIESSICSMLDAVPTTAQIIAALPTVADPENVISIADEREGLMMESAASTAAALAHFEATGCQPAIAGFEDLYAHPMIGAPIRSDYAEREAAFEAELDRECEALFARLTR